MIRLTLDHTKMLIPSSFLNKTLIFFSCSPSFILPKLLPG